MHVNPPSGVFGNTTFIVSVSNFVYDLSATMWVAYGAAALTRCRRPWCPYCTPSHRDDEDATGLRYNFYVKPPTGVEYALFATPAPQTSVIMSTLPVGVSTVRAVAVDSSDDRSYTEAVSINVTVAASQVTSDTLQQLLDETVAS